jgi:hypothetical protein
LRPDLLA